MWESFAIFPFYDTSGWHLSIKGSKFTLIFINFHFWFEAGFVYQFLVIAYFELSNYY